MSIVWLKTVKVKCKTVRIVRKGKGNANVNGRAVIKCEKIYALMKFKSNF